MFLWLGIALIIDGVDGTLARQFRVAEVLPRWSGDMLDFVVDFTTYVFVPAYAMATGGLLPRLLALPLGLTVAVTGALYFADRAMKTPDNYFRGFPALWNIAAFYLLLLRPGPVLAAACIAVLAVMTFVPFPFIHPVRVRRYRAFNIAVLVVWAVLAIAALARDLMPPAWVTVALCVIGIYVVGAGLFRTRP